MRRSIASSLLASGVAASLFLPGWGEAARPRASQPRASPGLAEARSAADVARLLPGAEGRWRAIIGDAATLGVAAPEAVVFAALKAAPEAAGAAAGKLVAAAVAARPRSADRIAAAAAAALMNRPAPDEAAIESAIESVARAAFAALWVAELPAAAKTAETLETLAALISIAPPAMAARLAAIAAAATPDSGDDGAALLAALDEPPQPGAVSPPGLGRRPDSAGPPEFVVLPPTAARSAPSAN